MAFLDDCPPEAKECQQNCVYSEQGVLTVWPWGNHSASLSLDLVSSLDNSQVA